MPEFFLEKKKFSHSSCVTYIVNKISAAEIDALAERAEILLSPNEYKSAEDAPLIGIILALEGAFYSIDEPYVKAVLNTGANIKFITYAQVEEQVKEVDGILLIGGCFLSPDAWYVTPQKESTGELPPRSRAYLTAINYAIAQKMPLFGVCGGMQMMAGVKGAKLMNIAEDFGYTPLKHRGIDANEYAHDIAIAPGSLLFHICGTEKATVNSAHGEAVASVPEDKIKISARASDGIIEAIEYIDYAGYALGVQWHPERMAIQGERLSRNLYQRLTDEAQKFRICKKIDKHHF